MAAKRARAQMADQLDAAKFMLWVIATTVLSGADGCHLGLVDAALISPSISHSQRARKQSPSRPVP
jgi:hypothetical protein